MKKSGRQRKNKVLKYKTDFLKKKNFLRLSLYSLAVKRNKFRWAGVDSTATIVGFLTFEMGNLRLPSLYKFHNFLKY